MTTTDCSNSDASNSELGYSCNGLNTNCQAYLVFRSQSPYNTVASISSLLAADPSQVSAINSVSETATFDTDKLVIVPVLCSCSGQYYQANTSYVVQQDDNEFLIANNTYQGLSTCQAINNQTSDVTTNIYAGETLTIPLRCACPTKNQTDVGVKYLLSYLVTWGDFVSSISVRFSVDIGSTLNANELSEQNANINPFTTLLVPLQNPPSSSQTIAPPPPPSSPPPPSPTSSANKSSKKTWVFVVVGVLGGSSLLLVLGTIIFCIFFRKTKRKSDPKCASESFEAYEKPTASKLDQDSQDFLLRMSSIAQSLKVYKFEDLKSATDNFSPSCWIRESVFRGNFNGDFAAIKKMNGDVSKEISILNKINHSNLIRLSGVCFNDGDWYLVYEYAVNGSLSDWIYYNNSDGKILNWTQRMQIALDVATGLNYLHSFTNPPHVHKDIRSSAVLLDSDFRAKIANFALARSAEGQDGEFTLTRHIVGTKGYMAPEYLENGLISTKMDVYAFGVLMLEILTGKQAGALFGEGNMNVSAVLPNEEDGQEGLRNFLDPSMQGNYPLQLVIIVVRLIDSCLKKDPTARPAMDEIVTSLTRIFTSSLTFNMSNNISGFQM
ncbi:LysM domain-containing protein/Pkinase_Tyr domain-containing protein [Cephalotus follicularis]|uniref:LysM domain-containing protein/Pkinase_Tyr domain-containing protein n=1 Tax=Cephalotus follicularis TaxID=3775 RepID=A0A1Q3DI51_CEPFO|nr:LysM domain-containing protein/Pkinase_Tyr domain-containing protein [Cephalotus follicularis]